MTLNCYWKELLGILPPWLGREVDKQGRDTLQEIRLRLNQPVLLVHKTLRTNFMQTAKPEDLQYIVNAACRYSPWTASGIAKGYLTSQGGHRIGLCGQAVVRDGVMTGIGALRSVNIRVARDFEGISRNLWLRNESILVIGPPGSGKTTLLRDLIRQRAQRQTVSVVDEREELFPSGGLFSMGQNTDVLSGCKKAEGIEAVLRSMTPDCIAVDEITAADDCEAMLHAGWCGVQLLATAHAGCMDDLHRRPLYAPILQSGLFDTIVILQQDKTWRTERITS